MKKILSFLFLLLPLWLSAQPLEPYRHNFFTTNPAPVVDVVAGSNTVVTPSLIGTDTRKFTVSATATPAQTNFSYSAITNAPWQWGTQNLTNWSQLSTNVLGGGQVWTNDSGFIHPSNTNTITIGKSGGIMIGTNALNLFHGTEDPIYPETLTCFRNIHTEIPFVAFTLGIGETNVDEQIGLFNFVDYYAEKEDVNWTMRASLGADSIASYFIVGLDSGSNTYPTYVELHNLGTNIFHIDAGGNVGNKGLITSAGGVTISGGSFSGNGSGLTNLPTTALSAGSTNQVLTQTGWSGYPQLTNLSLITNSIGSAVVPTLWLTNPTPASLGAQQNSPVLMQAGQGWRSGNSTTMPVAMGWGVVPVQGSAANPIGILTLYSSISNSALASTSLGLRSDGQLRLSDGASTSGNYALLFTGDTSMGWYRNGAYWTFNRIGDDRFRLGYNDCGCYPPFLIFDTTDTSSLSTGSLRTSGGAAITKSLLVGSNITASATVTATNGFYYVPQNNGTNPANSLSPIGAWGSMMGYTTNLINGGANTYAAITNFTIARTNQFGANLATGTLTNLIAGFYRIGIHLSAVSVDAGAVIEGELFLNGIERDEVSFLSTFDPGTPRLKGVSAMGILYITNNTPITFQVKSSGAGGVNVYRSQLVIGTP